MLIAIALAAEAAASSQVSLRPELQPMAFLVGHCWRGAFTGAKEYDTHCFEPALDGQHIRDRHEVTGGPDRYAGETLYSWDPAEQAIQYTYYNTQGGVSRGHMRVKPGALSAGEDVYVSPDGKRSRIATEWRPVGTDAYDSITTSPDLPSMNRTLRYHRVGTKESGAGK